MQKINNDNTWGILSLWHNWLLGYGAITLLILMSLWMRPLWLPFVAFALQGILFVLIRRNRAKELPACYILPFIVSRVLFWTGVTMVLINFFYLSGSAENFLNSWNPEIPFITVLITSPVATAIAGWGFFRQHNLSFCRDCRMRNGTPAERGFLGKLYTQEGTYQVGTLFILSALVATASWIYYFVMYMNDELTPLDRFFYIWLSVLIWIVSSAYLALRYLGLLGYYNQNVQGSIVRHGRSSRLRFLLFCEDKIALLRPESDPNRVIDLDEKLDTPTQTYISRRDNVSVYDAQQYLLALTHLKPPVDMRFMYSNIVGNAECNIFHYLCFLTPEQRDELSAQNTRIEWFDLSDIVSAVNHKTVAPLFAAEMVRLHTVAMAWKTYHSNGRRRYSIKNYKPTFRFADIHKWDVDYNNPMWTYVADNNQDTPFYHCRRFWRKYVNGIGQ
ncbi:MAG: hypothetical protein J6C77_06645 [Muribaculaceae bacterium]|nr:hypothetical protein [Muribaculaceae bacterium]